MNSEDYEEHPWNSQAPGTDDPRFQEDYVTQVSEEIKGILTKELSEELTRTESHFVGTLSKLDEFLLNSQVRAHSGRVPDTSRNSNGESQETN